MNRLIDILNDGKHSLVVESDSIHTFDGRGVKDLYYLYTELPHILLGASVADKVVGKGAAALMVLGKVSRVHADVISAPALSLLESNHIDVSYSSLVDNIINRQGSGICPVESLCLNCSSAEECLPKITQFLTMLKN